MENLKLAVNDNAEFIYTVECSDTLTSISKKFSSTENLIICDNNLKREVEEGDKLYIKRYKMVYVICPLDTLESVCNKFNVTKEDLLFENKITYIYPGERIIIP